MNDLNQQFKLRYCFRTFRESRSFCNVRHGVLCVRFSDQEFYFVFEGIPPGHSQTSLMLGYLNGSCGIFGMEEQRLHFRSQIHLNDQLSNSLAHYLIEEIQSASSEDLHSLENLAATLWKYLWKKHCNFLLAKSNRPLGISPFKFKRLRTFIQENLDAEISTNCMAEIAGLSPFHFIRMFKRSTGLTPHQFVSHMRMEHAKDLLKQTELPIIEICLQTGFNSPSHFSRTFKRNYGLTPLRFRQEAPV